MTFDEDPPFALIDDYPIDVFVQEAHIFQAEITEFPVESGGDIVDNIRAKPIEVTVTGIVSNAAFGPIVDARNHTSGDDDVTEAYKHIRRIQTEGRVVSIRTSLQTFESMGLKSFTVNRGPGSSESLEFTAVFIQVTTVENKRFIRVAIPDAVGKTKTTTTPKPVNLVHRAVDQVDGTWYDPDIEGWREGASLNPQTQHWEFFKGRPLGENQGGWQSGDPAHHKSDEQYRKANTATAIVPTVDKKTGKAGPFALAPDIRSITFSTDGAEFDNVRPSAVDKFGNPVPQ